MIRSLSLISLAAWATPLAVADPCTAKLPSKAGDVFAGTVRYIGDGDSLCVGRTSDPSEWIEVRVEDFNAPELSSKKGTASKKFLEDVAKGKTVSCTVMKGRSGKTINNDRVIARCAIGGISIGDLLRRAGAPEGGR
jgi:hypothetical protein